MDPAVTLLLRGALALLLGSAAVHKARDLPGFRAVVADYRLLPAAAVPLVARALVGLEGLLAASLLLPTWGGPAAGLAASLLLLYGGAIAVNLARGRSHIDCGCGGPAPGQPLGPWLLLRNGVLVVAALAAAAPAAPRDLVALDFLTAGAGAATVALLYAAVNHLAAAWPAYSRLRSPH